MRIIIKQKYFAVGSKFKITDENDAPVFFAVRQFDRIMTNVVLFDTQDVALVRIQAELKKFFTSYFEVNDMNGCKIFAIDEKLPFFRFKRAKTVGDVDVKIKCGPIHMKAFLSDGNGSYDKKNPVVRARKKIFSIADTYVVDIDESRLHPVYGAVIGLWYDLIEHGSQH